MLTDFITVKVHDVYARLSAADYSMLGVFGREHATQTEDTEIVPINKISDDIQCLVKVAVSCLLEEYPFVCVCISILSIQIIVAALCHALLNDD